MKKLISLILALVLVFSFAGCSGNSDTNEPEATSINVEEVYAAIESSAEMNEMTVLGEDMILNLLGIKAEKTVQLKVAIAAHADLLADEIWLVEAVDEAAAQEIVELANQRIETQSAASITYSPEQPKSPKNFPGPGTTRLNTRPESASSSRSVTYPSRAPSHRLMTSLQRSA